MHLFERWLRIAAIPLASLVIVLAVDVIAEMLGWALPIAKAE